MKLIQLFIIIFSNYYVKCQLPSVWEHHIVLKSDGKYHLKWNSNEDQHKITFLVEVETRGWVGFGLSPNGGMTGSDVVIGWVDGGGKGHLHDRYAEDQDLPSLDEVQDWHLIYASENETHTSLAFYRAFKTCDEFDLPITKDTMKIIWAYHEEDPSLPVAMAQHKPHDRGSRSIHLVKEPGPETVELVREELNTWDITSSNMLIPNGTTYWCKIVKVPFASKRHVIKLEPIISPATNIPFVHHMVLYRCIHPDISVMEQYKNHNGANCFDFANMPLDFIHCQSVYMVWATGGDAFTLPKDVGLPLSEDDETTYFLFEIHYDNPSSIRHMFDSSGLRLFHTKNLRKYDGDTATMGSVADYRLLIPPRQPNITVAGHCHPKCFRNKMPKTGINLIAALPHGHMHLKKILVRHFRGKQELPPIAEENNYDFNYQDFRRIPGNRVILPDDQITVECTYDTSERDLPLFGGLSTQEEMCIAFIIYYPRMKSTRTCLSGLTPETVMKLGDVGEVRSSDINDMNPIIVQPSNYANQRLSTYIQQKSYWDPQLMSASHSLIRFAPQKAQCFWRKIDGMHDVEDIEELIEYPQINNWYEKPEIPCFAFSSASPLTFQIILLLILPLFLLQSANLF